MSQMRSDVRELKGDVGVLKSDVGVLKSDVGVLKSDVSVLKDDVSVLKDDVSVLKDDVNVLKGDVGVLKDDVSQLKTITSNTAKVVAGHTEQLTRIEGKLLKLDQLDALQKTMDACAAEILASRKDRVLFDRSFSDQRTTLADHEARLLRLERERRPS